MIRLVQSHDITIELSLEEDNQDFEIAVHRCIDDIEDNEHDITIENDGICDIYSNNSENYNECEEFGNSTQADAVIDTSDLDNFVTSTHNPDLINNHDDHNIEYENIPTKNVEEESFEVIEEITQGHYVSSHDIY